MPPVWSIGWSVHARRKDKFFKTWMKDSINWKSRTNKAKTLDQAFAQASLPGGGGLPSFAPLVTSSAPQSTFVSFCHSVRPFPIPPLKSSGSKRGVTLRHLFTSCLLAQMVQTYYTMTRLSTSLIRFLLPNPSNQNSTSTLYPSLDPTSTPYGITIPLF